MVLGVNHIVHNRLIAGIRINGVDLAVEGIFDLPTNVSLVYLLAQACYLRCRAGWGVHRNDPRGGLIQCLSFYADGRLSDKQKGPLIRLHGH